MTRRRLLTAAGPSAGGVPGPLDPPGLELPWDGPTNLVVDGNSISTNTYSSIGTLDEHLMMEEPLQGSGSSHSCFASSGHNWLNMALGAAEVDAAWAPSATNVLFAWETTNAAGDVELSAMDIVSQIQDYIDGRLELHPGWKILLGGTIPRGGDSTFEAWNTKMEAVDAYLTDHWEEMGAAGFVNFREAHPAFDHHGTTSLPFFTFIDFWQEKSAGQFIHLTDTGKVPIAQAVNAAIAGL